MEEISDKAPMLLVGIGGAGAAIARGVKRAYGEDLRFITIDTDAASGHENTPFYLLGGDRLSGRGAGGDIVTARLATEDSIAIVDEALEDVRLAVIVTCLGGGTGGGGTLEAVRHFKDRGIPTVVFATIPFAFEGPDRLQNARGIMPLIEEEANASFFVPLDKLVGGAEQMDEAMRRAVDTLASGVTLFWRLAGKPGYIRLDAERIRHLVARAGRARFATVTAQGANRVADALAAVAQAPLLTNGSVEVRAILCGVLAGDDLRLAEVGEIAQGVRSKFGETCAFELATVNDETTFSGRISLVVMLFESTGKDESDGKTGSAITPKKQRKNRNPLAQGPQGRGRFNNAEPTVWNGEDLDIPTFLRRNINLDL